MKKIKSLGAISLRGLLFLFILVLGPSAWAATTIQSQQCDFASDQCNNGTTLVSGVLVALGNGPLSTGCNGPYCGAEVDTILAPMAIDAFGACVYVDNPPKSNGVFNTIFAPFGNSNDWQSFLAASTFYGATTVKANAVATLMPCIRPSPTSGTNMINLPADSTCGSPKVISGSPYYAPYTRPTIFTSVSAPYTKTVSATAEYSCGSNGSGPIEFVTWNVVGSAQISSFSPITTTSSWTRGTEVSCYVGTATTPSTSTSTPCSTLTASAPSVPLTATDVSTSPNTSVTATTAPATLTVNSGDQITLSWNVTGTTPLTVCKASGNWSGTRPASGLTPPFTPPAPHSTYVLTCNNGTGANQTNTATINVIVNPPIAPPTPPVVTLTATDVSVSPSLSVSTTDGTASLPITAGNQINLSWSVANTTSATICTASGSWRGTQPTATTTPVPTFSPSSTGAVYTLTCSNGSGASLSSAASIEVNVSPAVTAPIVTLTATDNSVSPATTISATDNDASLAITAGNQVELSWSVANTTSAITCKASGSWSGAEPMSTTTPAPTFIPGSSGATYSLTCSNGSAANLSSTATITVNVNAVVTSLCGLANPVSGSVPFIQSGNNTDYEVTGSNGVIDISGSNHGALITGNNDTIIMSGGSDNCFTIDGTNETIVISGNNSIIYINGSVGSISNSGTGNRFIINGVPGS